MEQNSFHSNEQPYRLKDLNDWRFLQIAFFSVAILQIVLLLADCIRFNYCYYDHGIIIKRFRLIRDGDVVDDAINGAVKLQEIQEILLSNWKQRRAKDFIGHEKWRGSMKNQEQEGTKNLKGSDFEVLAEAEKDNKDSHVTKADETDSSDDEKKIALLTDQTETAQENVQGDDMKHVFHDENGIPPDSFFALNSNPYYERKCAHRKQLKPNVEDTHMSEPTIRFVTTHRLLISLRY